MPSLSESITTPPLQPQVVSLYTSPIVHGSPSSQEVPIKELSRVGQLSMQSTNPSLSLSENTFGCLGLTATS